MYSQFGKNYLGIVDYLVIAATLLFSLFIGLYYAFKGRKSVNNEELLTGSRQMGAIPVAASMLVSYMSAITILGYPAEVYTYGLQILLLTTIGPVMTFIAALLFVEVMHSLKLTSAYKYLELRYQSAAVRWLCSLVFIAQLLLTNGIVLYAPAIALETMMGVPVWMSITGVAVCGTIYTSIGGIKAVVWTDVFQFLMILVGMMAICWKAVYKSGGISAAFETARNAGRLQLIDWTVDPFMRHNTLNILLGNGFAQLFFVVHQPVVQRYCSLPTYRDAFIGVLLANIFGFFTIGLVVFVGVFVFAAYSDCDPVSAGFIAKTDQIVPFFVIQELAFIPGMMGLFAAVVFSAVLSTISSTLNSLAAVTWEDFLTKLSYFQNMKDLGQSLTYKLLTIFYAIVIVVLAFYAQNLGSIVQAAITVVSTCISIICLLDGCFPAGAITGMLVSISFMTYMSISAYLLQSQCSFQPRLNFSTNGCSNATWAEGLAMIIPKNSTLLPASELEFPQKLFTVSYILYPLIGGCVTISIAIIVSLLTGGREQAKNVKPEYLHRLIRPKQLD